MWVDQRHVEAKSYKKLQLKPKYHLLRRKYYVLKVHSQVWDNFWLVNLFKNDKKWFLFHFKRSFRSQVFVLIFGYV